MSDTVERTYRPDIERPPARMAALPIHRGYPVPWFVGWVDGPDGPVPEFRCADQRKLALAITDRLCWVCGGPLGRMMTFVLGPMCGVNRISAEPPCHYDGARCAAK